MRWRRVYGLVVLGVLVLVSLLALSAVFTAEWRVDRVDAALWDPRSVALEARGSVVAVEATTCAGVTRGTGFTFVEGSVLTNQHLVDGASVVVVTGLPAEISTAGVVVRADATADLAIVSSSSESGWPPLVMAEWDAKPGTGVVLVGAAGGQYQWLSGSVHAYADGAAYGVDGPVMLLEPPTTYGYSGGPVIDGNGNVVGVLHAVDNVTELSLAIPASTVRIWLDESQYDEGTTSCTAE